MTLRQTVLALTAVLALAGAGAAEVVDRVLALVGPEVITLSDVRAWRTFGLVPPSAKGESVADVLSILVDRQLELSEVERYSAPEPDRAAVDRRVAEVRARFASAGDFEAALARTAMTEGRLRDVVADNLRIEAYIDQRFGAAAQPTADEVQRYYTDHPREFTEEGRLLPFDEVQPRAAARAAAERRAALVADWLDRLRSRGQVEMRYSAGATSER